MKKSRQYLSMPIISVSEGQQLGSVRGLVLNPKAMEVSALLVDQKGFFKEQRVIPYAKVKSVGDHAITVDKVLNAEKVVNLPEIVTLLKDKVSLIGTKVITETGKVLGVVEEYYVQTDGGKILCLEIASNFLSGFFKGRAQISSDYLVTMGKDVIIAAAGAEEKLAPVETGVSETLKNVVDSTSNLWYSSVQRTKELSKHFKGKERIELPPVAIAEPKPDLGTAQMETPQPEPIQEPPAPSSGEDSSPDTQVNPAADERS